MANWDKLASRGNVTDRRGSGLALGGGLGIVGVVVTLIFNVISGNPVDINDVIGQIEQGSSTQSSINSQDFEGADDYEKFASTVLGSTDEYWSNIFSQNNLTYAKPELVLFRSATRSGCGLATSQVGPHYCPADSTIYIDETFFAELQQRFKAKGGDVAEAYVIAHEAAHHVQNQLGTMEAVSQRGRTNEDSINLELQADCYAGLWAHSISDRGVFEAGEINEAVDAAAAVGDDRIQQSVNGQISPETWTHGSSEQRVRWFTAGYESGDPGSCDTFGS